MDRHGRVGVRGRWGVVLEAVRALSPSYFAVVMGTGIVSIGLRDLDVPVLSAALMWVAATGYLVLLLLTGWRLAAFPARARGDLIDPGRGFGYFTFVAGTGVLGARLALAGHRGTATALLVVGGLAWLALGYLIPCTAALGRAARPVVASVDGTWFLWVVATQSVAVLAAAVEPGTGTARRELALLAVFCWSIGTVLYAAVGALTATRLLLYETRPVDLTPPYWVVMGATAITVLAGAHIDQMAAAPAVTAARGMIAGVSVVFWAFGTWLIPLLLAAGWWRHVTHRVPLRYDVSWWSIVFPLGMYGVATRALGDTDHLPVVAAVGRHEVWVALAAWAATALAMLLHLAHSFLGTPREPD